MSGLRGCLTRIRNRLAGRDVLTPVRRIDPKDTRDLSDHADKIYRNTFFLAKAVEELQAFGIEIVQDEVVEALARTLAVQRWHSQERGRPFRPETIDDVLALRGFVGSLNQISGKKSEPAACELAVVCCYEDVFKICRNLGASATTPSIDLFKRVEALALAATKSSRGFEAIRIINASLPDLTHRLKNAVDNERTILMVVYRRCLRGVMEILEQLGAPDYGQRFLEPLAGLPEEIIGRVEMVAPPLPKRFRFNLEDYQKADAEARKFGEYNTRLDEFRRYLEDKHKTDNSFYEIVEDTVASLAIQADQYRANAIAARIWSIVKDDALPLHRAEEIWCEARAGLLHLDNAEYRLAKLKGVLDQDLDDRLLATLRERMYRDLIRSLLHDPRALGWDLDTIFLRKRKPEGSKKQGLSILRRWSSSHPLVPGSKSSWNLLGGGLFIKALGVGLAIDPGPDFLGNLSFFSPYEFCDITHVFVSHRHIDHSASVERIFALDHERSRNRHGGDAPRLKLLMYQADEKEYARLGARRIEQRVELSPASPYQTSTFYGKIDLTIFNVKHVDDVPTCAAIFEFTADDNARVRIGYTADAAFAQPGADTPVEIGRRLGKVDILVANISTVTFPDLIWHNGPSTHLGLSGILAILESMESLPTILVISEFALQNIAVDYRLGIVSVLRQRLQGTLKEANAMQILVGETGLTLGLDDSLRPRVQIMSESGLFELHAPLDVYQHKTDVDSLSELIRTDYQGLGRV